MHSNSILTNPPIHEVAQWVLSLTFLSVFLLCVFLVVNSARAGLSHVPGPFLAKYTNAWSLFFIWRTFGSERRVKLQRGFRERYGDVVRTGPRSVTVFDPAAIPVIYGVRTKLDKVREKERAPGSI